MLAPSQRPQSIILTGDCRTILRSCPAASVNCCVTSPPYFGLRDYGVADQIGLEQTPDAYVAELVAVFREVRRVLRDDGTLWLNLGDSYAGSGKGGNPDAGTKQGTNAGSQSVGVLYGKTQDAQDAERERTKAQNNALKMTGLKSKDLIGIPWRVAFALQADGWYLRQDIVWHKPNPMPESVADRCTKAHEYIFLLSKSAKYYFDNDAVAEPLAASGIARLAQANLENQEGSYRVPGKTNGPMKAVRAKGNRKTFRGGGVYTQGQSFDNSSDAQNDSVGNAPNVRDTRNRRSVWTVATTPFKEAHFATFPPALVEPCILAGCPPGGIVLDPFAGAGTTGLVATTNGRRALLIELNPTYAEMARRRIEAAPQKPVAQCDPL